MKKALRLAGVILLVLFWIIRMLSEGFPETSDDQTNLPELCDEFVAEEVTGDIDARRIIQRSWNTYQHDAYCASYASHALDMQEAEQFRSNLHIHWDGDYMRFWNELYYNLSHHDSGKLNVLQDSLYQIAKAQELSSVEFAELIVSFVQDIPYEFVLPEACTGNEDKPCNGNVQYGIYSPSEFIWQLKGDCDTRTVLLYTLLQNFGFNAAIFVSRQYEHSMLGIDLPAYGDYLSFKGTNFYFWETTNVGWMPGVIPPEMNTTAYWSVALD
jgi:hypothetical protein